MVLAPYLHGERYSSYGRHFTSHKLLHDVAERCGAGRAAVCGQLGVFGRKPGAQAPC